MLSREATREIIAEIGSRNPWIEIHVKGNELVLRCETGSLTKEQEESVRKHKESILHFLTTPPLPAQCRKGHAVEWACNAYGVWTCALCYREKWQLDCEAVIARENRNRYKAQRELELKKQEVRSFWVDV